MSLRVGSIVITGSRVGVGVAGVDNVVAEFELK